LDFAKNLSSLNDGTLFRKPQFEKTLAPENEFRVLFNVRV
jgi:hypothetical protein